MARTRPIANVITETAPPLLAEAVSIPVTDVEMVPRKVRSTLDLPAAQHREFKTWAEDAGRQVNRPVQPQHVLRALVARLLTDKRLAADILNDLRK